MNRKETHDEAWLDGFKKGKDPLEAVDLNSLSADDLSAIIRVMQDFQEPQLDKYQPPKVDFGVISASELSLMIERVANERHNYFSQAWDDRKLTAEIHTIIIEALKQVYLKKTFGLAVQEYLKREAEFNLFINDEVLQVLLKELFKSILQTKELDCIDGASRGKHKLESKQVLVTRKSPDRAESGNDYSLWRKTAFGDVTYQSDSKRISLQLIYDDASNCLFSISLSDLDNFGAAYSTYRGTFQSLPDLKQKLYQYLSQFSYPSVFYFTDFVNILGMTRIGQKK